MNMESASLAEVGNQLEEKSNLKAMAPKHDQISLNAKGTHSKVPFLLYLKRRWRRFLVWLEVSAPDAVLQADDWLEKKFDYDEVSSHKRGYGHLAAWMASDPNFSMGRNYADLRVLVRLHKQYKVEELKARLKELNVRQFNLDEDLLTSIQLDIKGEDGERDRLMQELDVALREHDELELREKEFAGLARPSKRNYRSLINQLYEDEDICPEEEVYFLHPDQMVSLANGSDNSWLDSQVEKLLDRIPHSEKLFTPKHLRHRPEDRTHYYSKNRVAILSRVITVFLAASLLVVPIALLYELSTAQKAQFIMTIAFVIGFPILLAICTRSKQLEIFAVSAAYCAVLVVFLTNFQTSEVKCNCSTSTSSTTSSIHSSTATPKPAP